eukprot:365021-Chlamydomonas_euryale.AAC.6
MRCNAPLLPPGGGGNGGGSGGVRSNAAHATLMGALRVEARLQEQVWMHGCVLQGRARFGSDVLCHAAIPRTCAHDPIEASRARVGHCTLPRRPTGTLCDGAQRGSMTAVQLGAPVSGSGLSNFCGLSHAGQQSGKSQEF